MSNVESFDSMEEMIATLRQREDAAMAGLMPAQRELIEQRSFYWMRPAPEYGCVIFGHYDLDESLALEKRLTPEDEMAMYPAWVQDAEHKNLVRGYKSGRAYSIIEPDGELGDTHVSNMWPISKESFEQAKAMGWDVVHKIEPGTPLHEDMAKLARAVVEMNRAQS